GSDSERADAAHGEWKAELFRSLELAGFWKPGWSAAAAAVGAKAGRRAKEEWRGGRSGSEGSAGGSGSAAPHTYKLHVIERYRRPDLGHVEVEITLEDPGLLTKPHPLKRLHTLD